MTDVITIREPSTSVDVITITEPDGSSDVVTIAGAETVITVEVPGLATPGPPGPQGPPGDPATGAYVHTQALAATVWTVQHNLGFKPAGAQAFDGTGVETDPLVTHVNDNVLLMTFLDATAGTAYVS